MEAEDLVQEVLIAIHTRRHAYDRSQLFTLWVAAIARYKFLDYLPDAVSWYRPHLERSLELVERAALDVRLPSSTWVAGNLRWSMISLLAGTEYHRP